MRRLLALLVIVFLTGTALSGQAQPAQPAAPQRQAAESGSAPNLLQFTAGGHILGFQPDGIYAAARGHALHVTFQNANAVQPAAAAGSRPAGGETAGAAPLGAVTWMNLWSGISLTASAVSGGIYETTYTLAPGAQAASIRLQYNAPVHIHPDGQLAIALADGELIESAPLAWQEIGGQRRPVEAAFVVSAGSGRAQVGFALGAHDPAFAVIIDPRLVWDSPMASGSSSTADFSKSIALDASGSLYLAGYSYKPWSIAGAPTRRAFTQPTSGYGIDLYVVKLNASGAAQWMTFLGGADDDYFGGLTLDGLGNVYVAGASYAAWGSPVQAFHSGPDAFVARLNSDGTLSANTFVGGMNIDYGIALAFGNGGLYLGGSSQDTWGSPVRPFTSNGVNPDTFVAQLNPASLAVNWNTFLGGTGNDMLSGLVVDAAGNAALTGTSDATWGAPKRAFTASDGFAARLDGGGHLLWNTFLGGAGSDGGVGIALDSQSGSLFITGYSGQAWSFASLANPVNAYSGSNETFVVSLNYSGDPQWYTFLGSAGGWDTGFAVTVSNGLVFLTGYGNASWGSPLHAFTSGYDCVVAALDKMTGALQWNTFYGGEAFDQGSAIAVDGSNPANLAVYVFGDTGSSWGSPVRPYAGAQDAFAMKLTSASTYALQWNTFLGAGQDDRALALAVDPASGTIFVAGDTNDSWNPYSNRDYTWLTDAYVQAFTSDGYADWVSYLGGSGQDFGSSLVFANNKLYAGGLSYAAWGSPIVGYNNGIDGFVAQLDPANGSLLWNTFIGGSGLDALTCLTATSGGQVYAGGYSSAAWGAPSVPYTGGYDGFVTLINADGSRMWNTFLGGGGSDFINDVNIHGSYLYAVGSSDASWGSPIIEPYSGSGVDAVVVRIDPSTGLYGLSGWVSFLGGAGSDYANAVVANAFSFIYVGGQSSAAWGTPRRAYTAGMDGFVAYLSNSGSLQWNTFLGGAGADAVTGVTLDSGGTLYVTGTSDASWGAPLMAYHAASDIFVSRLTFDGYLVWNVFLGGPGADVSKRIAANGIQSNGSERIYTASTTDQPWSTGHYSWWKNGSDGVLASLDPRFVVYAPHIAK